MSRLVFRVLHAAQQHVIATEPAPFVCVRIGFACAAGGLAGGRLDLYTPAAHNTVGWGWTPITAQVCYANRAFLRDDRQE